MRRASVLVAMLAAAVLVAAGGGTAKTASGVLFEDFHYAARQELRAHGWIVRTKPGWPGIRGATWSAADVTLVDDPALAGNRLLRLSSSTDGTPQGTTQTQICHQRKYREGTYATRVRFRDRPSAGAGGDHLVETFYTISPLRKPLDPSYSELDFEYLPNGGWGLDAPTLWVTSWETFSPEPKWKAVNASANSVGTKDGWHVLVLQVAHGSITYFVDGVPLASHGGPFYPEVPMSINYNLWFIRNGFSGSPKARRYDEDVDWVFHAAAAVLSPQQVATKVAELRRARAFFRDTVPAGARALPSPCDF